MVAEMAIFRVDPARPPAYVPRTFRPGSHLPTGQTRERVAQPVEQLTFNQ